MRYTLVDDHLFTLKQLVRDQFTTRASTPFRGFYTIDIIPSTLEMHFFVPVLRIGDYEIHVNNTDGVTYTLSSPEHVQTYLSWDRKYKVHTFRLTPVPRNCQNALQVKKTVKQFSFIG